MISLLVKRANHNSAGLSARNTAASAAAAGDVTSRRAQNIDRMARTAKAAFTHWVAFGPPIECASASHTS